MTNEKRPVGRLTMLARAVRSGQPSTSSWPSALRRGLLVAVIVGVGAAIGEFATASTIAVGALNLGLVDAAVPRRELARTFAAICVITALIACISAGVAGTWWAVPMLMVLAYATGAIGSAGLLAFNSTFMALVTGVLFTNDPGDWRHAAWLGLLVLIGSILQAVSGLIAWRYEREATLRRSMVNLVTQLRRLAESTKDVSADHLRAASAQMAVELLIDGAGLSPGRELRYRTLLQQLSWTRMCMSNWIGGGHQIDSQREYVVAALTAVDGQLRKRPSALAGSTELVEPAGSPDPAWQTLRNQLDSLATAAADFHESIPSLGDEDIVAKANGLARPPKAHSDASRKATDRNRRANIAALLRPGSPGFRHALRLAVAVGVSESIVLVFSIDRGYWIVLTVVMVVKPDFSTTLVRGILRVVGTAAAVVVAGSVLNITGNPQWLMVGLIVVFAPLTMRWMSANYAFASFAIGSTVLVLIEAGQPGESTITLRLLNTLLGAAISVAAYLLWPRWAGDGLRSTLSTTLRTQQHWTDLVLSALAGRDYQTVELREAGSSARDAMLSARPVIDAAVIEPHRAECDTEAAMGILNAVERSAMATLSIEVQLHGLAKSGDEDETAASVKAEAAKVAEHFDADFTAAQSEVARDHNTSDTSPTRSAALVAANRAESGPDKTHWPDPSSTRAIERLLAAADATVIAARRI